MTAVELAELLSKVSSDQITTSEALAILMDGPFRHSRTEFAELDHHRTLRHGIGEVVYGEGKTADQLIDIVGRLSDRGESVLVTRIDDAKRAALAGRFPDGRVNEIGRTFIANPREPKNSDDRPFVAVIAAGTSDAYVAEEACETCFAMSTPFERFYDIGVAGLHRVLDRRPEIQRASALIVVAGMEGALPSVVGGLFGKPIFAVPTSVGYGASFGGISALLGMLNSCAPGVAVLNIDNGFSAAFAACQVVREIKRFAHE